MSTIHICIHIYIDISDSLLFWVTTSVTAGVALVGEQLLCTVLPRLEGFAGVSSEKLHEYMTLTIFQVCASWQSPSWLHCWKMKIYYYVKFLCAIYITNNATVKLWWNCIQCTYHPSSKVTQNLFIRWKQQPARVGQNY